jgi:hypothetical protein
MTRLAIKLELEPNAMPGGALAAFKAPSPDVFQSLPGEYFISTADQLKLSNYPVRIDQCFYLHDSGNSGKTGKGWVYQRFKIRDMPVSLEIGRTLREKHE